LASVDGRWLCVLRSDEYFGIKFRPSSNNFQAVFDIPRSDQIEPFLDLIFKESPVQDRPDQESSLTSQLKARSRRRRNDLGRMAQTTANPRGQRNDPLPLLAISYVPLVELRPAKRKVRRLDPVHVREVARAIGSLGFCQPILVGHNNEIIDGELRFEAAKLLDLDAIPCVRIDHLSPEEQRVLRLAVNRLAEKGEWDLDALKIEFEELILVDAPIEIAGFTLDEVDQIIVGEEMQAVEPGPIVPDSGIMPVARVGDVFALGPHRLTCGDSTDPQVLARLMEGDAPARLVLTDEPYNVKIAGHATGGRHREFAMASGEMSDDEFLAFNTAWIAASMSHLCVGGIFGTFIDWRGLPTVHSAAIGLDLTPLNLIVWAKTNGGMGSLYRSQHELLPLFKKGDAPHVNNVELGKKGRWRSNVWTYPGASSLGSDARKGLQDHPTVKPTAMLEDALLDLTHRADIVLDPFLGSGSTLIAAAKTGPICRGAELDPLYVDVILRRYRAVTGETVVLIETGESFPDLEVRRATRVSAPTCDD
jgi:DNA modification methylase